MKTTMRVAIIAMMGMSLVINAQNKIETTGNVGIGTLDPKAGLHIANNYRSVIAEGLFFLRNIEAPVDKKNWYFSAKNNGALGLSIADDNYSWKKTILNIDGYTGNLGVGTSDPKAGLHIANNYKSIIAEGLLFLKNTEAPVDKKNWYFAAQDNGTLGLSTANDNYSWKKTILNIDGYTGNVGIGTTQPKEKLEINGSLSFSKLYDKGGNFEQAGTKIYQTFSDESGSAEANIQFFRNKSSRGGGTRSSSEIRFSTTNSTYYADSQQHKLSEKMIIKGDGKVGIGTITPDMKLTVNGNIHAKEVKIDLNIPAPDYVFKSNYKLRSLEEVESFIRENSHLPEIPSAKEFAENGVMQAAMDMNLLKKIEELTLYTIEQEKEIKELKKQNSKIQELEKLVKKLIEEKK